MKVVKSNKGEKYIIPECPGCKELHFINVNTEVGPTWSFNQDLCKPTFSPSLNVTTGKYVPSISEELRRKFETDPDYEGLSVKCHSFIRDGYIQFLDDCTHQLKGKTVELPEIDFESKFIKSWKEGNF